jgi:hypothetical protein
MPALGIGPEGSAPERQPSAYGEVSNFFSRLLQPPKQAKAVKQPDDISDFDTAWNAIKVGQATRLDDQLKNKGNA